MPDAPFDPHPPDRSGDRSADPLEALRHPGPGFGGTLVDRLASWGPASLSERGWSRQTLLAVAVGVTLVLVATGAGFVLARAAGSGGGRPAVELPMAHGAGTAAGDPSGGPAGAVGDPPTTGRPVGAGSRRVVRPGVYRLAPGSRLGDLVQSAGGLTPEADGDRLNLAAPLVDGAARLRAPAGRGDASRAGDRRGRGRRGRARPVHARRSRGPEHRHRRTTRHPARDRTVHRGGHRRGPAPARPIRRGRRSRPGPGHRPGQAGCAPQPGPREHLGSGGQLDRSARIGPAVQRRRRPRPGRCDRPRSGLAVPIPVRPVAALAVGTVLLRRPVLVLVAAAALASGLSAQAVRGAAPARAARFDGSATLVGDPATIGGAVRAEVRAAGHHFDIWARGRAAAILRDRAAGQEIEVVGAVTPRRSDDRWARQRHVVGSIDAEELALRSDGWLPMRLANALRGIVVRGADRLPRDQRALYGGFVLGDTRSQSAALDDDFRGAGLGHLLVVSGENVAFVLAVASPLLRRLGSPESVARDRRRPRDVRRHDPLRAVRPPGDGDGRHRGHGVGGRPSDLGHAHAGAVCHRPVAGGPAARRRPRVPVVAGGHRRHPPAGPTHRPPPPPPGAPGLGAGRDAGRPDGGRAPPDRATGRDAGGRRARQRARRAGRGGDHGVGSDLRHRGRCGRRPAGDRVADPAACPPVVGRVGGPVRARRCPWGTCRRRCWWCWSGWVVPRCSPGTPPGRDWAPPCGSHSPRCWPCRWSPVVRRRRGSTSPGEVCCGGRRRSRCSSWARVPGRPRCWPVCDGPASIGWTSWSRPATPGAPVR